MATVSVQNLRKVFPGEGRDVVALEEVSFEASGHTFVSIVGSVRRAGSPRLLNILAGVETPTEGRADITDDGSRRPRGLRVPGPRLLPWRSVMDNMLFVQPDQTDEVRERAARYLDMVGPERARRRRGRRSSRAACSSGSASPARSRSSPDPLLMDEPFSHLDAITARGLRRELHEIWMETKKTVLFVTHDVVEAVELSDRIVHPRQGREAPQGPHPRPAVPRDPADDKVALTKAEVLREFEELDLIAT